MQVSNHCPSGNSYSNLWEHEKTEAIDRMTDKQIKKARIDLFKNSQILDEIEFDHVFEEFRMPDLLKRNAEQIVPIRSRMYAYDDEKATEYSVICKIEDPVDAAILLHSKEIDVVLQALEALITFTETRLDPPENESQKTYGEKDKGQNVHNILDEDEGDSHFKCTLINQPGFLRRVIRLMSHRHESICRRAVILFGSLSQIEGTIEKLEHVRWLSRVYRFLSVETQPVVLDWMLVAVRNLSVLQVVQRDIFKNGAVELLLDLVTFDGQDPDVMANAMETLINICADHSIRSYLVNNGGFEVATELALCELPNIQHHALVLMKELITSSVPRAVDKFHESDGVATLLTILDTIEFQYIHGDTLEVLEYLMGVPSVAKELAQKRIYDFLLDMATSKKCMGMDNVQTFALRCVANAAKFPEERLMMNKCDLEKRVVMMLSLQAYSVVTAALESIGQLAKALPCRERLNEHGVTARIAHHMESGDPGVREMAFFAAGSLMLYDQTYENKFIKEGLMDHIFSTLTEAKYLPFPNTIDQALSCVINLSSAEALKETFAKFIVKYLPTWLSQPDEALRIKALICAVLFVKTESACTVFEKYKGFYFIGRILKDQCTDELARNVCWAISVLATDRSKIIAIASSGCIPSIMDLRNAPCPVTRGQAQLALLRLADLHTSFKFALLGEIGATNRINHGFYDAGRIIGRRHFWSLRTLLRMGSKMKQHVVFVSLPRKYFGVIGVDTTPILFTKSSKLSSQPAAEDAEKPRAPVKFSVQSKKENSNIEFKFGNEWSAHCIKKSKILDTSNSSRGDINISADETVNYSSVPQTESSTDQRGQCTEKSKRLIPRDGSLRHLMQILASEVRPVKSLTEEIHVIARLVADRMGGTILIGSDSELDWKGHLNQLARKRRSYCIPIGEITTGMHFLRAYLFKVLADRVRVPVTLTKGCQGRGWNEIYIPGREGTQAYLIDLMHSPGKLILKDSEEGKSYMEPKIKYSCNLLKTRTRDKDSEDFVCQFNDAVALSQTEASADDSMTPHQFEELLIRGRRIMQVNNAVTESSQKRDTMNMEAYKSPQANAARKAMIRDILGDPIVSKNSGDDKNKVTGSAEKTPKDDKPVYRRVEAGLKQTKWSPLPKHVLSLEDQMITHPKMTKRPLIPKRSKKGKQHNASTVAVESMEQTGKYFGASDRLDILNNSSESDPDDWDVLAKEPQKPMVNPSLITYCEVDANEIDVPEGYKVEMCNNENISYDEQKILEAWEMDLDEDDMIDPLIENADEFELDGLVNTPKLN